MKTTIKNPADLRQHWTRKLLNRVDENSPQFLAMCDAIIAGDVLPPIYIVEPNQVVAGWTRTLAYRKAQKDIECIVITEDESLMKSLLENALRLHLKKFQVAWLACPISGKVAEASVASRVANLKSQKPAAPTNRELPGTLEDLADQLGISRRLLLDARAVYDQITAWDKKNAPRCWGESDEATSALDYYSSRIMDADEPCTPGQAWAGIAGSDAAVAGKTNPEPKQLQLFTEGLASLRKWGGSFVKFEGGERKRAQEAIRKTVASWPLQLRQKFALEIRRMRRMERKPV